MSEALLWIGVGAGVLFAVSETLSVYAFHRKNIERAILMAFCGKISFLVAFVSLLARYAAAHLTITIL